MDHEEGQICESRRNQENAENFWNLVRFEIKKMEINFPLTLELEYLGESDLQSIESESHQEVKQLAGNRSGAGHDTVSKCRKT